MSMNAGTEPREISRVEDGRVAVVVVTYNSAGVIARLLESLPTACEGLDEVTLIVVDNASHDQTLGIVREVRPDAMVVQTGRNAGYAAAFNAGVRAAGAANAFAVLNPDLVLAPRALTRLVETWRATGAGIVVPRLHDADGQLLPSLRRDPSVRRALGEALLGGHRAGQHASWGEFVTDLCAYTKRGEAVWASGAAMLISRACLEHVGPWDESFFLYSEETEFCLRAGDAGWRLVYEPAAHAMHIGGDAPTSPRLHSLQQTNRVRLFARRASRLRTQAFRAALVAGEMLRSATRRREIHHAAWRALLAMRVGDAPRPRRRRWARRVERGSSPAEPHVLIVVENLPVPLDRRVWLEAQALVEAGYRVSVICPKGPGDPAYEELEGVRLHKYPAPPPTRGAASFVVEFAYCWLASAWLTARIRAREPIDVFQACNPPDTFFALAALLKPFGTRFVFDQHDLCPEIYRAKFTDEGGMLLRGLHLLERLTYRTADHVIATNDSYRRTAIDRGGVAPERVSVVRNGPDLSRLYREDPQPQLRGGRAHLAVYLGIMGPQDGVEVVLRAAAALRDEHGRDDIQFALLGFGDQLEELQRLTKGLDLDDRVTFTGRADDTMIRAYLSTADVGLSPDPPTPFNDASTMNKTMEYMAFGVPVVAFDLTETRVSAGEAAVYAEHGDHHAFAQAMAALLDDPAERAWRGRHGQQRVREVLAWPHQRPGYLDAIQETLQVRRPRRAREA